jgi:hypothetical protein
VGGSSFRFRLRRRVVDDCESESKIEDSGTPYTDNEEELLRTANPTKKEIEKQQHKLRLQQKILRLNKAKDKIQKRVQELEKSITGIIYPELNLIKEMKAPYRRGSVELLHDRPDEKQITEKQKRMQMESGVIRTCIILHARSPGAYEYLRRAGMVNSSQLIVENAAELCWHFNYGSRIH